TCRAAPSWAASASWRSSPEATARAAAAGCRGSAACLLGAGAAGLAEQPVVVPGGAELGGTELRFEGSRQLTDGRLHPGGGVRRRRGGARRRGGGIVEQGLDV